MTGVITLSDGGQNYIEFDVLDDVITQVRPAMLAGWRGCPVKNMAFSVGEPLKVLLWNEYELELKYPIAKIEEEEIKIPHVIVTLGTASATERMHLIDKYGAFVSMGVRLGDAVSVPKTGGLAFVTEIISETDLSLSADIVVEGDDYDITREAEA